jgi:hypothetical protein
MGIVPFFLAGLVAAADAEAPRLTAGEPIQVTVSAHPFTGAMSMGNGDRIAVAWSSREDGVKLQVLGQTPVRLGALGHQPAVFAAGDGFFVLWTTTEGQRFSGKTEMGVRVDGGGTPLEKPRNLRPSAQNNRSGEWPSSRILGTEDSVIVASNYTYNASELWRAPFGPGQRSEAMDLSPCGKGPWVFAAMASVPGQLVLRLQSDDREESSSGDSAAKRNSKDCRLVNDSRVTTELASGIDGEPFLIQGKWRQVSQRGMTLLPFGDQLLGARVLRHPSHQLELSALSSAGKALASVTFAKRRGSIALLGMAATTDSVWLAWSETDAKARLWIARVRVQ